MPVPGRYFRTQFGPDELVFGRIENGSRAQTMATLNNGWCARFMAPDTRDIYSVWVNWSSVTSPGTVRVRIETIDTTSGKPTGTLYDANATVDITPAAGWQQCTFASHPTTNLIAGNEYGLVLLTTVAGTTQTLRGGIGTAQSQFSLPAVELNAADGTTRTNFTEVTGGSCPQAMFGMSDGKEEFFNLSPHATTDVSFNVFGNAGAGAKFVHPGRAVLKVAGYVITLRRTGTPAGDLRVRILDSNDAVVAGTTVTISRNSLTQVTTRRIRPWLGSVVTLKAGTYRIVVDSASSANSSNCWGVDAAVLRQAADNPSGFIWTTTADDTVTHPTWTDTTTKIPGVALLLDDAYGSFLES